MSQEIFRQLLSQYFSGELPPAEKTRLQEMMNDPMYENTLESLVREIMLSDNYVETDNPVIRAKIDAWLDTLLREGALTAQPVSKDNETDAITGPAPVIKMVPLKHQHSRQPIRRRLWLRIAAAAAILLIALGSYWQWFLQPAKQMDSAQIQSALTDIAPGKTRAVLTLADSSKITLDSAKTGKLAVQGRTLVANTGGCITYTGKNSSEGLGLYNTLTTGRGEQSLPLTLSDGTKVWLNAASSIRYPVNFNGNSRNIEITGEAYLEVAKDKTKPFYVTVRHMEVEVLGTQFNINAYADESNIATTLLEGRVKIIPDGPTPAKREGVLLKPGQQSIVGDNAGDNKGEDRGNNTGGENSVQVKEADIGQVMAWKNGLFNFDHADIQTILRQLARWYDIDVRFEGQVPPLSFHGKITRDLNLSQVIKVLQQVEVKFRLEGRTLIVTS